MPVTSVTTDLSALTMTVVADFDAPVERLWDAYLDPRQLERFWGPPDWPATFLRHDAFPGGRSEYLMKGADGGVSRGYWEWESVDAPKRFVIVDGFAHEDGTPNDEQPTMRAEFDFSTTANGSRLITTSNFGSLEALEKLVDMGMEEGMRAAMSQIDAVLADLAAFAAGQGTESKVLSDTEVRITRVVRGPVEAVWRAHQDPDLVRKWLLGPDGWTMPVCEIATEVGGTYRYEWEPVDGHEGTRFGFTGELLELEAPHRSVTTERMIGTDGPSTRNEMTLTPVEGGTLLSIVITYPSAELRDQILATGMIDGMERSYQRLEDLIPA
jgi:uncharacterized protein YndB with AHSA1/START domain